MLYCVLLYTESALQSYGGGVSPQPPPVCSIHLDDATAATVHNGASALTTHQLQVERRERFSGWGLLGGRDWQEPVEGIWPGHWVTPLLFPRSAMRFLMTTESQWVTKRWSWGRWRVSEACCNCYIKYLNVEQQFNLLLMRKETNQLHHVKNDMIISVQLEPIACAI